MKLGILCASVLLAVSLQPGRANAGMAYERLIFVNMTPDAKTTAPSGKCVREIRAFLQQMEHLNELDDDVVTIEKMGETRLRRKARVPKGGLPFTQWTLAHVKRIDKHAGVVLVDCRPEENHIDVLVKGFQNDLTRIRIRNTKLTPSRLMNLRTAIRFHLWASYSV